MKNVFQAPNGKWFYKTYDENGSVIFNSFQAGEVYETQIEAYEASQGEMSSDEKTEVKPKRVKKVK